MMLRIFLLLCVLAGALPAEPPHGDSASSNGTRARFPVTCGKQDTEHLLDLWHRIRVSAASGHPALGKEEQIRLVTLLRKIPGGCLNNDLRADIRSAIRWMGILPCPPADIKEPVTIIISTERHQSNFAKKTVLAITQEALLKDQPLIFETKLEPSSLSGRLDPRANVVKNGDGELAYSFYLIYLLRWRTEGAQASLNHVSGILSGSAALMKTYASLKRPLPDPRGEALAKVLDQIFAEKETLKTTLNAMQKAADKNERLKLSSHFRAGVSRLRGLLTQVAPLEAIHHLAEALFPEHLKLLQDNQTLFHEVAPEFEKDPNLLANEAKALRYRDAIIEWRDRNLAFNGLEKACDCRGGVVRIHAALAHVSGVHRFLNDAIQRSGANDKVSIKIDASILKEDPELHELAHSTDESVRRDYLKAMRELHQIPREHFLNPDFLHLIEPLRQ